MLEILASIGFLWWVVTAIAVISWVVSIETDESGISPAAIILAFIVILSYFGGVPIWTWMVANVGTLFVYFGLYLAIGAGWTLLKWTLFNYDMLEKFNNFKKEFLQDRKIPGDQIPENYQTTWKSDLESAGFLRYGELNIPPKLISHHNKIMRWLMYWPGSILWSLLHDFVRRIFVQIRRMLSGIMEAITRHVFRNFDSGLEKK